MYLLAHMFCIFFFVHAVLSANGYVAYCPCMGRFGNQADHFLGALAFAKGLDRTLILPPWVEYRQGEPRSIQVPFNTYFKVEPLEQYHDVITMEVFMETIGPEIWPPEKRVAFCYAARGENGSCSAKEGNPFGPFWDTFNIDFVNSETYGPLQFDVHHSKMGEKWQERYPADKWPVLAFVGAPASFPVQLENRELQKYLVWKDEITEKAKSFIKNSLPKGGFVGIHLRNGIDWVRACEHIQHSPNLFAAPQCLGYRNENGVATSNMCYPTPKLIVKQLKRQIRSMNDVASVFVASDSNHMLADLKEALKRMKVDVFALNEINPHLDLAILGLSNHFIGNCISSFSAFVKRERDAKGFKSTFWAYPPERNNAVHEEL